MVRLAGFKLSYYIACLPVSPCAISWFLDLLLHPAPVIPN